MTTQQLSDLESRARIAAEDALADVDRDRPINPVRIAESLGVSVNVATFPESGIETVSGGIFRDGDVVTIVLNETEPRVRQRFTCAHELGHYLKRVSEGRDDVDFTDRRTYASGTGSDPEEMFANEFAGALLMPERELRAAHASGASVLGMARIFDVSAAAMTMRLRNLGLPAS